MGASYQVGTVVSWGLAGALVVAWGWRSVFWAPAAIFGAAGVLAFAWLRNSPESMGLAAIDARGAGQPAGEVRLGWRYSLAQSLGNPKVWVVALTFFCLHVVRYGYIFWLPTYLERGLGMPPLRVTWMAVGVPVAGAVSAVLAGWATDRFWGARRVPLIVIMLLALSGATLATAYLPGGSIAALAACLLVAGAAFGGADILLVGTLAMDIASRKGAGAAVGFIDAMGYLGAAITGVGAGWLAQHYGWSAPFLAWAVAAFLGVPLMATLWRYKPEPREWM
jgi:sugar phosphate permease